MEGLGIDWKILLLQIVNFLILLWLLKRFAYKPFLAILQKRQKQIEEGASKAEEAEKSLVRIRGLAAEVKTAAEKKAKEIISASEVKAQEKTRTIMAVADAERKKMIENTQILMERERLQAQENQQKTTVDLAFVLAEKLLKEKIDRETDKKIIEKLASEIK